LLQRVREAEREHLFEDFSGREGELVNGTVQSISGQHITIGLGRTEAILPKSQQVGRERYRAHDKIRVYVLEVRRTSRGPQIVVSRNHRNLLRRLLELEVPEIYNGQVEVKSIAREAGQRSKVAVFALQAGVDPVGACVGMRGVRIQSIVRELNDEKIDVIEWDPDQRSFISKALSPARVSHVFLEEHPDEGRTAVVIVPDDQLSLAIGREGQNARLAAKLTGWRIDIKSLTEAARDALDNLDHPMVDPALAQDQLLIDQVRNILDKKETGRPITSEDYQTMDRVVVAVEGRITASRAERYAEVRRQRVEMRKQIPEAAWLLPLDALDLPGRIHNLLLDNEIETVGDVMLGLKTDEAAFLEYRGFGDKMLETLKEYVDAFEIPSPEALAEAGIEVPALQAEGIDEVVEVEVVADEAEVDEMVTAVEEAVEEPVEEEEEVIDFAATIAEMDDLLIDEEDEEEIDLDDLSRSIVDIPGEVKAPQPAKKAKVVIVKPVADSDEESEEDKAKRRPGRSLVYDEDMGEVVVKRKRKGHRSRPEWEDIDDIADLDDLDGLS
jgi:N utilization substance protein A